MNLFWLDTDPVLAAQAHQDIHVGKMLLEAVQLLCTAFEEPAHVFDLKLTPWADLSPVERIAINVLPYAHTHRNHPCALWVRASRGNFDAAIGLAQALAAEFRYRFDKPHASEASLDWVVWHRAEAQVPDGPLQPFALAMPEKYNRAWQNVGLLPPDATSRPGLLGCVLAYRAYYRNEKRGYWRNKLGVLGGGRTWIPAKWTRRQPPEWF